MLRWIRGATVGAMFLSISPVLGDRAVWIEGNSDAPRIRAVSLETLTPTTLVTGPGRELFDIVADAGLGKMYWVDENRGVQRANLDGSGEETIIAGTDPFPTAVALDMVNGKLYWMTAETTWRANLDGSGRELVGFFGGVDLELDLAAGKIYWSYGGAIFRSTLEGTQTEQIASVGPPYTTITGLDITTSDGFMYWIEVSFNAGRIRRAKLNGNSAVQLVTGGAFMRAIEVDAAGGKMYWSTITSLRRAALDGSGAEVVSSIDGIQGIYVDSSSQKLYFTAGESDSIHTSNLDGTDMQVLLDSVLTSGTGVATDPYSGNLFWASNGRIWRADHDGSNISPILSGFQPRGLAIDALGRKLYWTDVDLGGILRANLDGSSVETILTGLDFPWAIAFGATNGRLYWSDWGPLTIESANLDGSDRQIIATFGSGGNTVDVDEVHSKVYWATQFTIRRADLDGTNPSVVYQITGGGDGVQALAVDPDGDKLYWTESYPSFVRRANLDGSGVETLVTLDDAAFPRAMMFDSEVQVPAVSGVGMLISLAAMAALAASILRAGKSDAAQW